MHSERIHVISYSGRRGEERPLTFILRGLRIDVESIVEQWIEERSEDRVRTRCFRITGSDGMTHRICYSETDREWYYGS